ncbi:rhomboid family intramembrane serine protease [candidate division KSB1 bacterium]
MYSFDRFQPQTTPAVKKLIIINVAVFFLQFFLLAVNITVFSRIFGLVPKYITHYFTIWQLVTYMFLHGGVWHILLNMFVLWMFGCEIEREWGSKEFLVYYFVTGIGAGIFNTVFVPSSEIAVIGASGAVYGILLAFGMMFPNRLIYIWGILPIKAIYLVLIMGAMAFMSSSSARAEGDNVAHLAHLGGMVVGFLYLKLDWRSHNVIRKVSSKFSGRPRMKVHWNRPDEKDDYKNRIDEILDKINEKGYDKLTEEEREILTRASRFYNNRGQ